MEHAGTSLPDATCEMDKSITQGLPPTTEQDCWLYVWYYSFD